MSTVRDPLDPGAQRQHLLPPAESERIFVQHIAPTLLSDGRPVPDPRVVLLSGQPAAGKTAITRLLRASFTADQFTAAEASGGTLQRGTLQDSTVQAGAVEVDVDELIAFHPELPRLRAVDELTAEDLVHADARRWLDRAVDHLIDRRVNILLEHGLRSRDVTDALLRRFHNVGYAVDAVLLATPAAVSLLGNLDRYQTAHETTGAGRFVLPDLHDTRYTQLLQVADWLQDDFRVRSVSAYRRDGNLLMHNRRETIGAWENPGRLADAVRTERERPWTAAESRDFLALHADLVDRMEPLWATQLHRARQAAEPLLHPQTVGADRPGPRADDVPRRGHGTDRRTSPPPTARSSSPASPPSPGPGLPRSPRSSGPAR